MDNHQHNAARERLVVSGADGYVGFFVTEFLSARYDLTLLVRDGGTSSVHREKPGIRRLCVSLTDRTALREAMRGACGVIHLAYDHVRGAYRGGEGADLAGWYDRNLRMLVALAITAEAEAVGTFLFLSSRAVYDELGEGHRETNVLRPHTHYGALKAASEMILSGFRAIRSCSVRSTGVYGLVDPPERSKWADLIISLRTCGKLERDRISSEVHGHDLARALLLLLERQGPLPPAVNLSDLVVSHSMVADIYAGITGRSIAIGERCVKMDGRMDSSWLIGEGFRYGGRPLLESTIKQLADSL
ncbi:MAG: NAD(P)-dependent oxidoreductase [Nitrospira sp.]